MLLCSPAKIHHVRLLPIQAHKAKATAKQGPNDSSRPGRIHWGSLSAAAPATSVARPPKIHHARLLPIQAVKARARQRPNAHLNAPSLELLPDTGRMIFPSLGKFIGQSFSLENSSRKLIFAGLGKFIGEASLLQLQPHLWPDRLDVSCSPAKIHHLRLLPIQAHKARAPARQGPNDFS